MAIKTAPKKAPTAAIDTAAPKKRLPRKGRVIKHRIWLTPEQQAAVIARYVAGENPPGIAKSLGICCNNVRNVIRRHGVVPRTRAEARTVYAHWKEAFDVITPESAYWIGFLFADGWIYKKPTNPDIGVGLALKDRAHLDKLRTFLKSEHRIYEKSSTIRGKTHRGVRFDLRSRPLAEALYRHGMHSKSLLRVASPELAESRDFWRGALDGDGWICLSNGKPLFGFCGGKILVDQFLDFLKRQGVDSTGSRKQGAIYRFDMNCTRAVTAITLLYTNACVALDRKLVRAEAIISKSREHMKTSL